ncbi:MAG: hypothetical protein JWO03_122 [Bacteroidetes bacterium]|nr:hypothetical protein [Bacteroidota bacterium]
MPNGRRNKPIAGYHILMILSAVDHKFSVAEDRIIAEYIAENFPIPVSLDKEMDLISNIKEEDYMIHFQKAMDDFYNDSTEKERLHLIDFAIKLTKATKPITAVENIYLSELYNEWTETVE